MITLHDIMSIEIETVTPETTLRDVASLFADRHISGAPVVSGGKVVGVISATDLLEFDAESPGVPRRGDEPLEPGEWSEVEPWREGDQPPSAYFARLWEDAGVDIGARFEESGGPESIMLDEHTAGEVMTRKLVSLPPNAEARQAARLMLRAGVHRILVMERGELAGVVTTTDIVKAVSQYGLAG